jgi:hypothetical protein
MARYVSPAQSNIVTEIPPYVNKPQQSFLPPTVPTSPVFTTLIKPIVKEERAFDNPPSTEPVENQQASMFPVQSTMLATPVEDAFAAFIARKAAVDASAKKVAIAQKSLQASADSQAIPPAISPTPWGQAPTGRIGGIRHNHFKVDVEAQGTNTFQEFIQKKNQEPVANGKRYTADSPHLTIQEPSQQPLTSIRPVLSNTLVANTRDDRKQNGTSFTKFDPHAMFNPKNWRSEMNKGSASHSLTVSDAKVPPSAPVQVHQLVVGAHGQLKPCTQEPTILKVQGKSSIGNVVVAHESNLAKSARTESTSGWETPFPKRQTSQWLNEAILQEAMASRELNQDAAPLTEDVMLERWGVVPRENFNTFDDRISDAGIEEFAKENVRGTQGKDAAEELLDWDKTWLPPPCVWEDRGSFDTSFVPDYIRKDWQPNLTAGLVSFDMTAPDFKSGCSAVNNFRLDAPIIHEYTIPGMLHISFTPLILLEGESYRFWSLLPQPSRNRSKLTSCQT